jgi:hypothetical protein
MLNLRRCFLPLISAVSIAIGSMVALPQVATAAGSPARGQTGTVAGTVQLLACGGAPPPGIPAPCLFRPLAGAIVELDAGGRTVRSTRTDAKGRYFLRATAGIYTLRVILAETSAISGDSQTVRINRHRRVEADFQLIFWAA